MQEQTDGPKAPRQVVGALAVCLVAGFCVLGGFATGWMWRPLPPKPALVLAHSAHKRLPSPPPPYTFPAGGRVLAGAYRFVALYGSPDEPALGALGQQGVADAVSRAKQVADPYRPLSSQPILPAFEIIATVASGTPTENGDYSREVDPAKIMDWVHAAQGAGMYVVIDLQPGRSDFLSQAKEYETVLREPNVGLALDPEWRLTPSQRPLEQIGSVGIDEVNGVASWLSSMVATEHLPQKLFVLHQFRLDMLPSRELLNTAHPELAFVIQMDGQGDQPAKQNTWQAITASPPPNVEFGWKNFYMKDSPMLDPTATMQIAPQPWYVSYQ